MPDIVIRAKSISHAYARLRVAGLRVVVDENDNPVGKIEETCERCCSPAMTIKGGDVVFAVRIDASKADKIPSNDTPNFGVVWRSDEDDMSTYPVFELEDGTMQMAGVIS